MGKTIVEKILSKTSASDVAVGDFGWSKVSLVSLMDLTHYCDWDFLERNGLKVWEPSRVIMCFDHFMYPSFGLGVEGLGTLREWAARNDLPKENVYDIGRHGNSHQIPVDDGWALPGHVYVGADSQAPTLGAFNCYTVTSDAETPFVLASGETWFIVPPTLRINLSGKLLPGVLGKDVYQYILKALDGRGEGKAIEIGGSGLGDLSIDNRLAISNGGPHFGASNVIFEADERLLHFLEGRAQFEFEATNPDPDASYADVIDINLSEIEPLVSGPNDPSKINALSTFDGLPVNAAFIGSCSAGRVEDLKAAADVLRGHKVHKNVRLVVTPLSSKVMEEASAAGYIADLAAAGATITIPGCGACYVGNMSPLQLADKEICISTGVENWPGRMGSSTASIYLANSATVAQAAIDGELKSRRIS